jgi:hypothetical protein
MGFWEMRLFVARIRALSLNPGQGKPGENGSRTDAFA